VLTLSFDRDKFYLA